MPPASLRNEICNLQVSHSSLIFASLDARFSRTSSLSCTRLSNGAYILLVFDPSRNLSFPIIHSGLSILHTPVCPPRDCRLRVRLIDVHVQYTLKTISNSGYTCFQTKKDTGECKCDQWRGQIENDACVDSGQMHTRLQTRSVTMRSLRKCITMLTSTHSRPTSLSSHPTNNEMVVSYAENSIPISGSSICQMRLWCRRDAINTGRRSKSDIHKTGTR